MSLILAKISKEKFEIKFEDLVEILIYSLIGGIIGARFYYCLFNLKFYLTNPSKILALRDGGLAIYGGLILGTLVAIIVSKIKKINFANLLDYSAPYLALTQGIGRIGNFFNVEAYGVHTQNIFRMGIIENGNFIEVHPCFLYEALSCFIIFIILRAMQKNRKYELQIFLSYIILYGVVRFLIEALRSDSLYFFDTKVSQTVSLVLVVIGMIIHINKIKKSRIL